MKNAFILGNPRSGTSLFRLMLHQHSQIVAPPESGFAHWWYPKYKNWAINDCRDTKRVSEYVEDVLSSKKIETWGLDSTYLKLQITEKQPKNYTDLTTLVYISYKEYDNLKVVLDKNNYYLNHLEDLPKIWENASFLHLIRDGRDVACSYVDVNKLDTSSRYKPKLTTNIKEIALEWEENNIKVLDFFKNITNESLTIRFEDLILETKKTLNQVCEFLSVPFNENMLQYYKQNNSKLNEPQATIDWKKKTKEKPDISRIGRFKEQLSPQEIIEFNTIANKTLRAFNYIN